MESDGTGNGMKAFRATDRDEWRDWLAGHWKTDDEIWLVFPTKAACEESVSYNDAVEEALCFGWIDGTNRTLDATHKIRRFTPRRAESPYSQPNIERLRWLDEHNMLMPEVKEAIQELIDVPFVFPDDILDEIRADGEAWMNYQTFSEPYKRIRIAYIDAARSRPEEFRRRLDNFIRKTQRGKIIQGYGGVDKYYK